MANKGRFRPINPKKYKGDPTNIIYRSSWEAKVMSRLDLDPTIISWSSEEEIVPYRDPLDNRARRYFPDFVATKKLANGTTKTYMIEVKPAKETKPPKAGNLTEAYNYAINMKKWEAAKAFCESRNWDFVIYTEKELGLEKPKRGRSKARR